MSIRIQALSNDLEREPEPSTRKMRFRLSLFILFCLCGTVYACTLLSSCSDNAPATSTETVRTDEGEQLPTGFGCSCDTGTVCTDYLLGYDCPKVETSCTVPWDFATTRACSNKSGALGSCTMETDRLENGSFSRKRVIYFFEPLDPGNEMKRCQNGGHRWKMLGDSVER
jgi:hypothetical protein